MLDLFRTIIGLVARWLAAIRRAAASDTGSTTIETVIIAAAMAAVAIAAMAAIALAIDAKVAGIQL